MTIETARHRVAQFHSRAELLQQDIEQLITKQETLSKEQIILDQVNQFLASAIQEKVTTTKHQLEDLVNQGLQYIFTESSISIRIDSSFKNNKTVFSLKINKDNLNSGRAEDFGGGVLAVVSFLLKICSVIITNTERFILFDESLSFISKEYEERTSQFIAKICEQLNFDIALVTHKEGITKYAHTAYEAQGNPLSGTVFKSINPQQYWEQ